jgi:hypothetical protein
MHQAAEAEPDSFYQSRNQAASRLNWASGMDDFTSFDNH